MTYLKVLVLTLLCLWSELASTQSNDVWMWGWHPAQTQEMYDRYISRLYVNTPYLNENFEKDVLYLYGELKTYEKISQYCDGKMEESLKRPYTADIKAGYQAWRAKNEAYIELITSHGNRLLEGMEDKKRHEKMVAIEHQNAVIVENLQYNDGVDGECRKYARKFAFTDGAGKVQGRQAEEERFSDSYRNIDFFLHPEKKVAFIKALKAQLDEALVREKACKRSGGTWKPVGMARSMACITGYPDAGKSCTDSSQCKGGCLYDHQRSNGNQVFGKCKEDNNNFGCSMFVKNGKRAGGMCVD